jgi:hypothetical protein
MTREQQLEQCLRELALKMINVSSHPDWINTFTMAQLHGKPYGGPTFERELMAAIKLLEIDKQ